jgi:elongation factor 1-gamma
MSTYTLYSPPGSFRAFKSLITAEYNGIEVTVGPFDAASVAAVSPSGKAPVLTVNDSDVIFESNAICRFLARIKTDTGLYGNNAQESAIIDSWIDFSANELELPATVWFYPAVGYMPFQKEAYVHHDFVLGEK